MCGGNSKGARSPRKSFQSSWRAAGRKEPTASVTEIQLRRPAGVPGRSHPSNWMRLSTPAKRNQPLAGVERAVNPIGCQRLQRRLFNSGHSGHSVSGWPEWDPRSCSFAKSEPQRSFFWAAMGLKWSGGEEDLLSTKQVLRSGNAIQRSRCAESPRRQLGRGMEGARACWPRVSSLRMPRVSIDCCGPKLPHTADR
jgi:hypothetical protein